MALDAATAPMAIVEVCVDSIVVAERSNAVVDRWLEVLDDPLIPWDRAKRKKKFSHVYDKLSFYVAHHEQAKKENR